MGKLEDLYQKALREQKAKRTRVKNTPPRKPAKSRKRTTKHREKRTPYSDDVDAAVAILLGSPVRHGVGSPGINEIARLAVKRKPRKKVAKKAVRKPAKRKASKRTTNRAPKSSRSRKPGESFAQHMKRLRKIDGR